MTFKLNDNYAAAAVLALSLLATGFLVAGAQTEPASVQGGGDQDKAVSVSSVAFPVAELGNCKDAQSCKKYCDDSANAERCLDFAEKHKLMRSDDLARARKMSSIVKTGGGPGGCKNKNECEAYCEGSTDRLTECLAFAEKSGLVPEKELQEMKQVQKALSSGAKLPGGCKNKKECDNYCSNSANIEECISFAEASGMIKGKELEEAKRVMPLMKRGETPGGCKSKEACEAYCSDSSHANECITFAEKAGFMSKEEAAMARKTGGRGPGGCNSKESCDAFCNKKENQETCFNFAKEHDLIPPEQLKEMEEGMTRLRVGLSQMPGEVVQCLKDKIGPDAVGQIESGKLAPSREIGETMKACFEQFKPQMAAKMQEGLKNAPPEITSCLQSALGEEGFQKLQQGGVDNPDDGDKVKACFEKMKEVAGRQMRDSAQQLNNLPPQARDCVKQKLGSDFFDKLQSGNPEGMQEVGDKIGPVVGECMSQFQGGQGGEGGFGPGDGERMGPPGSERLKEMMEKGGRPEGFPGADKISPEDIKEMMQSRGAIGNFSGSPTPEQVKEFMQKKGASSFPEGAPSPEQIKEMMQGKGIPGGSNGAPSPEQIKDMMQKKGASGDSQGSRPTPEQIKEMTQGKGAPNVEQIKEMMEKRSAPSPEQIKEMMQGKSMPGAPAGAPTKPTTDVTQGQSSAGLPAQAGTATAPQGTATAQPPAPPMTPQQPQTGAPVGAPPQTSAPTAPQPGPGAPAPAPAP